MRGGKEKKQEENGRRSWESVEEKEEDREDQTGWLAFGRHAVWILSSTGYHEVFSGFLRSTQAVCTMR
jgi:hypothetical protein